MDTCVDIAPSGPRKRLTTDIFCVTNYDLEDDLRRYVTRYSAYCGAGLEVEVRDQEGFPLADFELYQSEGEQDADDTDGDDGEENRSESASPTESGNNETTGSELTYLEE